MSGGDRDDVITRHFFPPSPFQARLPLTVINPHSYRFNPGRTSQRQDSATPPTATYNPSMPPLWKVTLVTCPSVHVWTTPAHLNASGVPHVRLGRPSKFRSACYEPASRAKFTLIKHQVRGLSGFLVDVEPEGVRREDNLRGRESVPVSVVAGTRSFAYQLDRFEVCTAA